MSEFERTILKAKKRQKRQFWGLLVGAIIAFFTLLFLLSVSKATRIEIVPEMISHEANVDVVDGLAFILRDNLYSLTNEVKVEATASGFKPQSFSIESKDFGKVIRVVLEPLPSEIILSTGLTDEKTSWYINDQIASVSNGIKRSLEAGDYKIRVSHPFYIEQIIDYTIHPGEVVKETIKLDLLEGELSIYSTPDGASVTVNTNEKGNTPFKLLVNGGRHEIRVSLTGYDVIQDVIEIKQGATVPSRNYRLVPKSAGIITTLIPSGGVLKLDGLIVTGPLNKVKIKPGRESTLSYSKDSYISQSISFKLAPDEIRKITFDLEKEIGSLEISANRPSEVFINGKKVGDTPYETILDAVPHNVEIRATGYRSVKRTVTPSAGSPARINAVLIPESEAKLAEASKTYKTRAGGEMVLFNIKDQIVMGAERGEPGQRANEFVKTATISRPFYAGRHEVTNGAYTMFKSGHVGKPQEPVTNISWIDAAIYANWLSRTEGLNPVYELSGNQLIKTQAQADGYRLLTEAEWEWLARKAGRKSQTLFTWGESTTLPKNAANVADESIKGGATMYVPRYDDGYESIAPVMTMQREKSGLFDMGGNVSEWTHDSYELIAPNKDMIVAHELDKNISMSRVVKGANYSSGSLTKLRAAYREGKTSADPKVGFRLGRFVYGGR